MGAWDCRIPDIGRKEETAVRVVRKSVRTYPDVHLFGRLVIGRREDTDRVLVPIRGEYEVLFLRHEHAGYARHRKMKPFPATAPQEKSHVRNWRSKGHLAPLMRPTKFPEIPVSLERN